MLGSLAVLALVAGATTTSATTPPKGTDFGVRAVSAGAPVEDFRPLARGLSGGRVDLRSAAAIGSQWGRVTSTVRSPQHNRRVGGVRNSFHISGRAIDIARHRGVSHAQIAAAYRNAGYQLIESLDEGDHSHFAFGTGRGAPAFKPAPGRSAATQSTPWRVVTVASAILK